MSIKKDLSDNPLKKHDLFHSQFHLSITKSVDNNNFLQINEFKKNIDRWASTNIVNKYKYLSIM